MTAPYTPQPQPTQYYGYVPGQTYVFNNYRMYLSGGYWYFVDYPQAIPIRAARPHYRTGGRLGIFYKWYGVIAMIAGIGLMFGHEVGFIVGGALCFATGIFGFGMAVYDSMRNHPTAWKVAAIGAVAAYAVHSMTDDD